MQAKIARVAMDISAGESSEDLSGLEGVDNTMQPRGLGYGSSHESGWRAARSREAGSEWGGASSGEAGWGGDDSEYDVFWRRRFTERGASDGLMNGMCSRCRGGVFGASHTHTHEAHDDDDYNYNHGRAPMPPVARGRRDLGEGPDPSWGRHPGHRMDESRFGYYEDDWAGTRRVGRRGQSRGRIYNDDDGDDDGGPMSSLSRPSSPSPFRNFNRNQGSFGSFGSFDSTRGFSSYGRNSYMLPSRVFDAVQDVIEDSSMFYVTFQCQPKYGKYLCKLQCKRRDERMTGLCEAGYCNCMLKVEKKMRKAMSKRFLAAMEGYDTDCSDYKKAKHCKRFCKALTPDKAFTGLCKDTHCQCITYPKTPEKKKNACTKAIKQLKTIEDKALFQLGIKPRPLSSLGAAAEKQVNAAAEEAIQKLKSNNSMDGCTEEDIQNLKGIIANLSQGLNLVKGDHGSSTLTGGLLSSVSSSKDGAPGHQSQGTGTASPK